MSHPSSPSATLRQLSLSSQRVLNTKIKTRINGATKTNTFISNVGTPQGDSLSPVLFIVYLEHALKEVRTTLPRPIVKYEKEIPNEIAYADDVDFIGQDYVNINEIQETLHKYQLKVNTDKTEFTALSKNEEDWKIAKKVGSLIGDLEDVERRNSSPPQPSTSFTTCG